MTMKQTGDMYIWQRRVKPTKRSFKISLVVDESGSMNNEGKEDAALCSIVVLQEVLSRLDIDFSIEGFSNATSTHKSFNQKFKYQNKDKLLGTIREFIHHGLGTNDAYAVSAALKNLEKEPSDIKVIIVITDGLSGARDALDKEIKTANNKGVAVVGIGIGSGMSEVKEVYRPGIAVEKIEELPAVLGRVLVDIIVKKKIQVIPGPAQSDHPLRPADQAIEAFKHLFEPKIAGKFLRIASQTAIANYEHLRANGVRGPPAFFMAPFYRTAVSIKGQPYWCINPNLLPRDIRQLVEIHEKDTSNCKEGNQRIVEALRQHLQAPRPVVGQLALDFYGSTASKGNLPDGSGRTESGIILPAMALAILAFSAIAALFIASWFIAHWLALKLALAGIGSCVSICGPPASIYGFAIPLLPAIAASVRNTPPESPKPQTDKLKLAIFDIGNVIVYFDFRNVAEKFVKSGYTKIGVEQTAAILRDSVAHLEYERGRLTSEEFVIAMIRALGLKNVDLAAFERIWTGSYELRQDTVKPLQVEQWQRMLAPGGSVYLALLVGIGSSLKRQCIILTETATSLRSEAVSRGLSPLSRELSNRTWP
jgi:hypothetical protein